MDFSPHPGAFFIPVGSDIGRNDYLCAPLEDYEETIVYKTHTSSFLPDVSGCRRIPLLGVFIH